MHRSDIILHQPIKTSKDWLPEDAREKMLAPARNLVSTGA